MSKDNEKLDPKAEFLFIASVKVALDLIDAGKSKADYLFWCMEIWDTIEKNGEHKMRKVVNKKIASDLHRMLVESRKGE